MVMTFELAYSLLFYIILVMAGVLLLCDFDKRRLVLITFWSICVIGFLDGITLSTVHIIFLITGYANTGFEHMIASLISAVFILLLIGILSWKTSFDLKKLNTGYFIVFLVIVLVNEMVLAIMQSRIFEEMEVKAQMKIYWLFLFASLGVFLQMTTVLLLAKSQILNIERQRLSKAYLTMQKDHYNYLEHKEETTRRFRHDMLGHMYILSNLFVKEDKDGFEKYMENVCGKLKHHDYISVGNCYVDAILNHFIENAKEEGITIHINGHMPEECYIEPYDLCTIFSNILTNALEAVKKSGTSTINLDIRYDDINIMIREENMYTYKLKFKKGKLYTTKLDDKNHGLGLSNIEETIKKYNGAMKLDNADNRFVIDLIMENYRI
jgi:signal transduction histidine kinase